MDEVFGNWWVWAALAFVGAGLGAQLGVQAAALRRRQRPRRLHLADSLLRGPVAVAPAPARRVVDAELDSCKAQLRTLRTGAPR